MEDDRSGALGCGCALPIGLVMGLVAFALVGALAGGPPPASTGGSDSVTLAMSESYLSAALTSVTGVPELAGWEADVLPDNRIALLGIVEVEAFGQDMGLPVRVVLLATAAGGSVELSLESAQVSGAVDATAATGLVGPLLATVNDELEARLASSLGPSWRVISVSSSDDELLVHLAGEGTW